MLLTSVSSFAASSQKNSLARKVAVSEENAQASFKILLANYKKAVYQDGVSNEKASKDLMQSLIAANLSSDDVRAYAISTMTTQNYLEFNKALSKGLMGLDGKNISEHKVKSLIESLVKQETKEGANWIGCTGLMVGIPLLAAGVITGIVALSVKKVQTSGVEKKYIKERQEALVAYTKAENIRQDNIVTYQSDISAYNNSIAELQRKISSGVYGALEIEMFKQSIASINVNISDAQADISQLVNDQPQMYQSFQNNLANINALEVNEMSSTKEENDRNDSKKKTLGIVSAITLPAGLTLTILGTDC
jgi:hypothetical protein